MASQFLNTIKYGLLTVVAFFGPKIITDSGSWVGNMEKQWDPPRASDIESRQSLIPSKMMKKGAYRDQEKIYQKDPVSREIRLQRPMIAREVGDFGENPKNTWRTVITPIGEIFRFDYYPAAMVQRWSRVDTVQSEYPLRGYRVVVLTGTEENDLSGVLTCYYNEWEMRRINFYGKTGDFSKTLKYLADHYGLKFKDNSTPNCYIYESDQEKKGEKNQMLVSPAPVFYADQKNNAFSVRIVLYRPE